jgi:endoribonuclease Dicer
MVERGNDIHHHILSHIMNAGADILRWTEALCKTANNSAPVPPRDIRESINPYHSDSDDDENSSEEYITDPTTSGRIYIQDATTVIYRFTAGLKSSGIHLEDDKFLFDFKEIHSGFGTTNEYVCSVTLHGTPIDNISGSPSLSKSQARRSACFEACRELSNAGLLDYRMIPLPPFLLRQHNGLPVPLSDTDERSSSIRCYPRKYPNFWVNSITGPIVRLYPVIVSISPDADSFGDFAPILILTRRPLPHLEGFKLFFSGIASSVRFQRAAVLQLNDTQQHLINQYTNRVFRAILNKPLTCSLEDSLYFIAPLTYPRSFPLQKGLDFPDVSDSVSWDLVSLAALNWAIPIRAGSADELVLDLEDAVVQDRWVEFTRRYNVNEVRRDMTPLSKPDDSLVRCLNPSLAIFI